MSCQAPQSRNRLAGPIKQKPLAVILSGVLSHCLLPPSSYSHPPVTLDSWLLIVVI